MSVLDSVRAERDQVRAAALAIAEGDEFDPDDKAFGDLQARADELDKRASTIASQLEKQAAADALDGRLGKIAKRAEAPTTTTPRESWGEMFTRSDVFTSYNGRGTSPRFEIDADQTRALPTGLADLLAAGFKGGVTTVDVTPPTAVTPLQDNIAQVSVSTNAIEYVEFVKKAGGAAIVPEKGAKPSVEYEPKVTPATLDNVAVYTQLTRMMIEDAPAVRSKIDGELRNEIARFEEAQAAAALTAATLPTASSPAGTDMVQAVRAGVATVQAAGYNPTAVLLNPADFAAMDMSVYTQTNNGPIVGAGFWGLRPIPSPGQPAGVATVGDFKSGAEHYYRSAIMLYVTDSHGDTFLSNVFTLLAERRSKTVIVRPAAFAESSVSATAATSSQSSSKK